MCGDNYAHPTPRAHEFGGIFGEGIVGKTLEAGSIFEAEVKLTANHMGFFTFQICNLDKEPESEACFAKNPVLFENGSLKYPVPAEVFMFYPRIRIPPGLKCEHCVLRWHYTAGNSWGWCDEDHLVGDLGCGQQELFITCSDISIQ